MFRIAPTPKVLPSELLDRAAKIEPATVGHLQNHGFPLGLRPVTKANRFVGTALTVRLSAMDGSALHYAADLVEPGHVVVVEMGHDRERACVGAMVCFALSLRGAAGVVIDGMATDIAELEDTGVPIFARGLSPVTTRLLGNDGDVNLPVNVAGAIVRPGDLVIADPNGVVFVHPSAFDEMYDHLFEFQDAEPQARIDLRSGVKLTDKFGAGELVRRSAIYLDQ
ncbi:RraA family protein [Rhizobium fabae]|uniref:Putative 4-hydroxy-4-methyl-2-oxoglutarate aldolase n=1 Tax=Rhizobium fabae TaxID=573179 RepID=A0A7W6BB66_9HYPH|nr:RraA family protein [Rhizobium fabae]MBB3914551.1 regulator of RNase E activity RraA [Rhizobium fabae]RUM14534.1 RraA family protein [Rhizobium fabae]